jgi:hypothetical protein
MSLVKDDFDGSIIVRQTPVSASSSMSEAWHTLGFSWNQKTPNIIYITAGTVGTKKNSRTCTACLKNNY